MFLITGTLCAYLETGLLCREIPPKVIYPGGTVVDCPTAMSAQALAFRVAAHDEGVTLDRAELECSEHEDDRDVPLS